MATLNGRPHEKFFKKHLTNYIIYGIITIVNEREVEFMKLQIKIWEIRAKRYYNKFLKGKLKNKGIFNCPRYFIIEIMTRQPFEMLCQTKNKTYYKLKTT